VVDTPRRLNLRAWRPAPALLRVMRYDFQQAGARLRLNETQRSSGPAHSWCQWTIASVAGVRLPRGRAMSGRRVWRRRAPWRSQCAGKAARWRH